MTRIVSGRSSAGFTLLEVLIAVVIVGILAAISVPSFQESIIVGRRTDAKRELLRLAQLQTKWRVNHLSYGDLATDIDELNAADDNYVFAVTLNTGTAFVVSATPTSNHGQANDVCGTLVINQDAMISANGCTKP